MSEEVILSATDEFLLAEIWLTPDRPDILIARLSFDVPFLPSCPYVFWPKLVTVPSLCNNNV